MRRVRIAAPMVMELVDLAPIELLQTTDAEDRAQSVAGLNVDGFRQRSVSKLLRLSYGATLRSYAA